MLTRDEAVDKLAELIVVPMTTTVRDLPNEVELDEADGMPRACVEKITVLDSAKMDEVCRALNATVAC